MPHCPARPRRQDERVTAFHEHPSLVLAVTPADRQAAVERLRAAYDEGALTASDYDRRAGMAAMASHGVTSTRRSSGSST